MTMTEIINRLDKGDKDFPNAEFWEREIIASRIGRFTNHDCGYRFCEKKSIIRK